MPWLVCILIPSLYNGLCDGSLVPYDILGKDELKAKMVGRRLIDDSEAE